MSSSMNTIYLADYQPPEYLVETIHLDVNIQDEYVDVCAVARLKRAHQARALVLHGNQMQLQAIFVNGRALTQDQFVVTPTTLTINAAAVDFDEFELKITTRIDPYTNRSLEGLYESKGMLCTQCEAEGFRRITYYIDRPDNMAVFTTRIEADQTQYPVLLANGNCIETNTLANNRHAVVWSDPYPKPCYLFALVAGDLALTRDQFTTASGRDVAIAFYTDQQDQDKIAFAIAALKKSMRWDEQRYGREYDLDIFMVVAVSHFNMGAMENKGLNIFNTRCVLASPDTTTDLQFASVEGIIAHEYFHNWSGNRVTCRDWFQLSLKEGFTVFRDQHFSMEVDSWLQHRVAAVKVMRSVQFAQDAGPMAHPIRPTSYIEINNFYTVTVYDKGAEVVRLYYTLLGPAAFRQGTDRYFERFDGEAVTTEDFMAAMLEGSTVKPQVLQRWYDQPGTPVLTVHRNYDEATSQLRLRFEQHYPALSHWPEPRLPVIIPIVLGLVSQDGQAIALDTDHDAFCLQSHIANQGLFVLETASDELCFNNVPKGAVPSLLRGFSAPVVVNMQLSLAELACLAAYDDDMLNRWDAAQNMMNALILEYDIAQEPEKLALLIDVLRQILVDETMNPETRALIGTLPSYASLEQVQLQTLGTIDVEHILRGQKALRVAIASALSRELQHLIAQATSNLADKAYDPSAQDRGWRAVRNLALYYLASLSTAEIEQQLVAHVASADNLTDRLAGCRALLHGGFAGADQSLQEFIDKFSQQELAMNAWFEVQASNPQVQALQRVQQLQQHRLYDAKSPNHVRSVIGCFCRDNPLEFHKIDGSGYQFLAESIMDYNQSNPQLAARLIAPLIGWRQYDPQRQALMQKALQSIMQSDDLAPDVFEITSKSLAG